MPRRRKVEKHVLPLDYKYDSELVTRFIGGLMRRGKKGLAQRIFYNAMDLIEQKTEQDPLEVFEQALQNVGPILQVRSRRVGGQTYQIPVEVRADQRIALAIRWIISYAKERSDHTMAERLAGELLAAYRNEGGAVKRREDTHRMAESNKAFAHYRW